MKHEMLRLFGINAAGIRCEIKSFDDVLSRLKPHIWMAQETKLKVNEKIDCDSLNDFQVWHIPIRTIIGYGVQENTLKEKKEKYWDLIEK